MSEWTELDDAIALAMRWQNVRTDESHGMAGKNLGIMARALLQSRADLMKAEIRAEAPRPEELAPALCRNEAGWPDGTAKCPRWCGMNYCQPGTERTLDKPAQVGATRFGVGVKWSTVIDRAEREWDYFHGLKNPRSSPIDEAPPSPLDANFKEAGAVLDAKDAGWNEAVEACREAIASVGLNAHEAAKAKDATDYIAGYQDAAVDCDEELRDLKRLDMNKRGLE